MSDYATALRIVTAERRLAPFLTQHGAEEFNLQHAAIGLLKTGDVRDPAARPAVELVIAALADRDWLGDEIMSGWLADAVAGHEVGVALPLDVDLLVGVLESDLLLDSDTVFYLDLRTGEQAATDHWPSMEDDEDLLPLPCDYFHGESWRDRRRFVAWVDDERLAERLLDALHRKGAYRRFRHVLDDYPELTRRFLDFADDRQRCRAVRWLDGQGIRLAAGRHLKAV